MLRYKGYCTNAEYDEEGKVWHGKIEGIKDLVTFESESSEEIEKEFHAAVDDYLEFCKEVGKEPETYDEAVKLAKERAEDVKKRGEAAKGSDVLEFMDSFLTKEEIEESNKRVKAAFEKRQ